MGGLKAGTVQMRLEEEEEEEEGNPCASQGAKNTKCMSCETFFDVSPYTQKAEATNVHLRLEVHPPMAPFLMHSCSRLF